MSEIQATTSAEYEAQLTALLRQFQEAERADLGREPLTWLALVPTWTVELAEAIDFPAPPPLESWLARAHAAGYCEQEESSIGGRRTIYFWMPGAMRTEVLGKEAARSATALRDTTADLADRLLEAEGDQLSPGVEKWARLARECRRLGRATASWLTDRIGEEVQAGRTDRALDWIDAGESLEPVLGRDIASAVARGKRRVNLVYRSHQDERFLSRFMVRDEQLAALQDLLEGPDRLYALHFIGMGGVGKTMLIRYISAGLKKGPVDPADPDAPVDPGAGKLVTSRIDFDHISPKYPFEKPGQLLLELATGLSAFVTHRKQEDALKAVINAVEELHAGSASTAADPIENPQFDRVVRKFIALVRLLPKPVVLILDTCEELAKLHPGGPVPAVEKTFAILQKLHAQEGSLRVILAGRRLLASRTEKWQLDRSQAQPASVVSLTERPYLRMHEIRGFTDEEAARFFKDVRELNVRDELLEAIKSTSKETGRVVGLVAPGADQAEPPRYNPYDLELYANWIEERRREGRKLEAADVRDSAGHAYVDARIISRIRDRPELQQAIPVAVLLRRFDQAMLAAALGKRRREVRRVFDELSEQEWIDPQGAEQSGETILAVEDGLLPRLLGYYGAEPRGEKFAALRTQVAARLAKRLREGGMADASPEWLEAALRLIDPEEAAPLWEATVREAVDAREWDWAAAACARVLGDLFEAQQTDEGEDDARGRLRASVRALFAAAQFQRDARADTAEDWRTVHRDAHLHPIPEQAQWLSLRANLAIAANEASHLGKSMVAAEPERWTRTMDSVLAADPDTWIGRQTVASALQAIEALLDRGADPRTGRLPAADLAALVALGERSGDAVLLCGARLCHARALVREGRFEESDAAFARAAAEAPLDAGDASYCDWRTPANPRSRVRLEWLLARGLRTDFPAPGHWLEEAWPAKDVDSERLLALALAERMAREPIPAEELTRYDALSRRLPATKGTCLVHDAAEPLFMRVAEAWLSAGAAHRALALLDACGQEPGNRRESGAASEAALGILDVVLRARWAGVRDALVNQLSEPAYWRADTSWSARTLVLGAEPQSVAGERPASPEAAHAAWRAASAIDTPAGMAALNLLKGTEPSDEVDEATRVHLALDREEARMLRARLRPLRRKPYARPDVLTAAHEAAGNLRERAERLHELSVAAEDIRLELRAWALSGSRPIDEIAPADSPRSWAELALTEGELLALRLPDAGRRLLELAVVLFERVEDRVGALLAATRLLIALLHDGERDAARAMLGGLGARYEAARAVLPPPAPEDHPDDTLPPWDAVMERAPQGGAWPRGGGAWTGWLVRLAQARRTLDTGRVSGVGRDAPVELRPVPAYRRRTRLWAWRLTKQVVRRLWVAFVLYGVYLGATGGREVLAGFGFEPPPVVGLICGFLIWLVAAVIFGSLATGAVVLIARAVKAVMRAGGSVTDRLAVEATVDVRPADGATPPPPARATADALRSPTRPSAVPRPTVPVVDVRVALDSRTVGGWLLARLHELATTVLRPTLANTARLEATAGGSALHFPPPFRRALRLARAMRTRLVRLRVAPGCAAVPWEWLLGTTGLDSPTQLTRSVEFIREEVGHSLPTRDADAWREGPVRLVCPVGLALAAEEDWAPADRRVEVHTNGSLADVAKGTPRVLHLIGSPVRGPAGWTLRLDDDGPLGAAAARAAALVTLDRLPLGGVGLVIVQDDTSDVTWDGDDELAGLAASVAGGGAAAVMTIPGLPPYAAAAVVSQLASMVGAATEPPGTDVLLAWARGLRSTLMSNRQAAGLEDAAAIAAALRIQLFVNIGPGGRRRGAVALGSHQGHEDVER